MRAQRIEQPLRELPSTDTNARATDAEIQYPQGKRNDFFLHLDRFETTSTPNNIYSPLTAIANSCANDWMIGEKSLG